MPKNVNLNHFSMWRNEKKIIGLSPNSIKHYILQFLLMVCFGAKIDAEGVIGSTKSIRSNKTRNRDYWI